MAYPYPVVPVGAAAFFGFPPVMPIDPHRGRGSGSGGRSRSRSRSRSRDHSRRERLHANGSRGTTTQQQAENRRTGGDSARTAQTIFVTGIHPKIDDMDLFEFFSHAGRVDDIQLIKDGRTGKSKGLAYVEFSNVEVRTAQTGADARLSFVALDPFTHSGLLPLSVCCVGG